MAESFNVATRKGLFRFERKGAGWFAGPPAFVGQPVTAVLGDRRDGTRYAALNLGHFGVKLHRSDDQGRNWTEVAAPALPSEPGNENAKAVQLIWTLEPGGPDEAGVLWAGTIPGGLFRSADRGASWSLVESLWNVPERAKWFGGGYDDAGIHSIHVDPRDPAKLTLGISCGGVWKSDDAGASWRNVGKRQRADYVPPDLVYDIVSQDPHRLAHCAANPDVVWCQHHVSIFRSSDSGVTFDELKNVKPSPFGFAVAAHPTDVNTAWFVPAVKDEFRVPVDGKFVVTKTTDGGKTFTAHSVGLPSGASYDLVYRHALDVDRTGTTLAMGSTTGNLWTSDDGGESWTLVSAHLPPIAQVSFA